MGALAQARAARIAPPHRAASRVARISIRRPRTPALVGIVEGEPLRLRIARALQMQAISAERSIWIANAYFVPSPVGGRGAASVPRATASTCASSCRRATIITGSSFLTRRYYRRLLTNGVRIWEWKGTMMHAKTSVVDGRWVRVGSTDFNPLGVAINYELDAVIEDATLGAEGRGDVPRGSRAVAGDHDAQPSGAKCVSRLREF